MIGTRIRGLAATVALAFLLGACGTPQTGTHVEGARGFRVTVTRTAACAELPKDFSFDRPLTQLPSLVHIRVGCVSLSKPSEIAQLLSFANGPDDKASGMCALSWGLPPLAVGTDAQGRQWFVHFPVDHCGQAKILRVVLDCNAMANGYRIQPANVDVRECGLLRRIAP
jgi:hypothetical protein